MTVASGEWWIDSEHSILHYKPLPHQRRAATRAVLPVLETLLRGAGAGAGVDPSISDLRSPISHLRFEGLSFRHQLLLHAMLQMLQKPPRKLLKLLQRMNLGPQPTHRQPVSYTAQARELV